MSGIDAKDELLRDIERELAKVTSFRPSPGSLSPFASDECISTARAPDAVKAVLILLARAKTIGGLRW